MRRLGKRTAISLLTALLVLVLAGCTSSQRTIDSAGSTNAEVDSSSISAIAELVPVNLDKPMQVVATTSIIGDVAHQVGGDLIDLTVLLPAGSDPHTWMPTPQQLVALSGADLLLINGVGLEEGLLSTLGTISGPQIVSVNEGVPIYVDEAADHAGEEHVDDEHADEASDHEHSAGDPHTWQDVGNVRIWAENIAYAFSALDPANSAAYSANADAYDSRLESLADEIAGLMESIPVDARKLVTDHDDLGYFARAHGFSVVGTIIPSVSAMASVSAQAMAALQQQVAAAGVNAIFVGNTVNHDLADQIAADTGVQVVPLYTDALGAPEGPASTYIDMMRYNANTIVAALKN
jgi:ABC-type Zn uptake system ZnuABC Zn-binding protein ZnuA